MRRLKSNRTVSVILANVLLFAQSGSLAHAYEHDPGSPQQQVCSTCIAGQITSSGCVDSSPHFEIPAYKSTTGAWEIAAPDSIHIPLARQRAPPTPL
jgi:hypothetical protein